MVRTLLPLYRLALAPLLLQQGRRVRLKALRLPDPDGPRSGEVAVGDGPPLRLLFVGDSSMLGVGVAHQREALAGPTAAGLAAVLQRPVHWQLLACSGITTGEALAMVESAPPAAADIAVFALGVNDVTAQSRPDAFIADYTALLHAVEQHSGARQAIVCGLPPMHRFPALPQPLRWYLGQWARALDEALRAMSADDAYLHHAPAAFDTAGDMARDGYHPGAAQYRQWSARLVERLLLVAGPSGGRGGDCHGA